MNLESIAKLIAENAFRDFGPALSVAVGHELVRICQEGVIPTAEAAAPAVKPAAVKKRVVQAAAPVKRGRKPKTKEAKVSASAKERKRPQMVCKFAGCTHSAGPRGKFLCKEHRGTASDVVDAVDDAPLVPELATNSEHQQPTV